MPPISQHQTGWSNDLFRLALEASPSGQIMVDGDGRIILVNAQIEHIFGYDRSELSGQAIELLIPQRFCEKHPVYVQEFFHSPSTRAMGAGRDLFGQRKDGSEVPVEVGLNPIQHDGNTFVLASVVDISARKEAEAENQRLQDQIQHAQRLESLGMLAGGIAHDFNNILVAILGHADMAFRAAEPTSPLRRHLDQIQKASLRAADLTKQMLAYAGKGKLQSGPIQLNELIRDMTTLMEVSIPKKTLLRLDLGEPLMSVQGDAAQLQQILLNLLTNASEAIGDSSGMIAIRTAMVFADESYLAQFHSTPALKPDYYVSLEVADTGCGMPPEVRERIFDPFFTTKFTGRGLGMAAVRGIVHSHNGAIQVYSEPKRGSKFKILLPALSDHVPHETTHEDTQEAEHDSRKILIIDDEEHVRGVLGMMLHQAGYSYLQAHDGHEGLMVYQAHSADISLIFLDMNMPRMGGEEVYRELHKRHCTAKLVLMSGYSEQEALFSIAGKAVDGFLEKPFTYQQVDAIVQRLLVCEEQKD